MVASREGCDQKKTIDNCPELRRRRGLFDRWSQQVSWQLVERDWYSSNKLGQREARCEDWGMNHQALQASIMLLGSTNHPPRHLSPLIHLGTSQ